MPAPKRPNYFQSQFLVVRDFVDEQKYHQESLWRHTHLLHEWGVVRDGLQVKKTGADFAISAGSAIDSLGREISLETEKPLAGTDVQAARQGAAQDVYVTIAFNEVPSTERDDQYPPPGGSQEVTRKVQSPLIAVTKTPASDGSVVILARIDTNSVVTNNVRTLASSFIARGSNLGDISLDGALSFIKTSPTPTPQMGLEFDSMTDQLRIRARTNTSTLDVTHLTIKRETGNVGVGTESPSQKLEVAGALKLYVQPNVTISNNNIGAYFWDQSGVGPTIAGKQFEVRTGGDNVRLRINNDGNVGLGTTDPKTRLHVVGGGSDVPKTSGTAQSAGQVARLKGSTDAVLDIGTGGLSGFWLQSTDSTNLATTLPLLLNPNGGKVGIGTTDPTTRLHVVGGGSDVPKTSGASQSAGQVTRLMGSTSHGLDIGSAGNKGFWLQSTDVGNLATNFPLLLNPNGGNVGIGTTDPAARFHVEGSGNAVPAKTGAAQSAGHVARLKGNANAVLDIGSGKGFWLQSTDRTNLATNNSLLLNPNGGNVGIGTDSPATSLHIRVDDEKHLGPTLTLMNGGGGKGAAVNIDLYTFYTDKSFPSGRISCVDNDKATGDMIFYTRKANTQEMVDQLKIDAATGEVKVKGSITCGGKIGLKSSHFTDRWLSARDEKELWLAMMHNEFKYQEEFYLVMQCSREFKENISDLTALEAMTTLQNLTPVKYDYKGETAFRQNMGFIAEDMPDNLSSEDRKSISPFEVVPILTKVAKEQQRVIAELQETVRKMSATKKHKTHKQRSSK